MAEGNGLYVEVRGDGDPVAVLLHGLNGTGAVWNQVDRILDQQWPGTRMILDLPGHGASLDLPRYSLAAITEAVAETLLDLEGPVHVLGHSMGGAVCMALASGWFDVKVAEVVALGVKVDWSVDEIARAHSMRARQRKSFPNRAGAEQAFWRSSGISPDSTDADALLERGIVESDGTFRLTADPRAASMPGEWMETLFRSISVPLVMARGDLDPMVPHACLRGFDYEVIDIPGAAHNAHLEQPDVVADLFLSSALKSGASATAR
jgi:pimeloyl-ACP methyl ester carboxylesterase